MEALITFFSLYFFMRFKNNQNNIFKFEPQFFLKKTHTHTYIYNTHTHIYKLVDKHIPIWLVRLKYYVTELSWTLNKKSLWNSFRVLFFIGQVAWKNEITREIFRVSSSYRVGCLEQLDHSRNFFCVLFYIGQVAWKNETTREILRVSSSYRAGRLKQLDHFFLKKRRKNQKKNQSKKKKKRGSVFHVYFSLQNLLYKVKRKWIFQCLCTVSIVNRGQLL
jgi:hypothetical protein